MTDEKTNDEPSGASGGSLAKPSGVAAACAAAADIGCAMQAVEGFPTKQLQWEMVGKDTDGTPIYRNNWGEYRRWIPASERLPDRNVYVLVFIPKSAEQTFIAQLDEGGMWFSSDPTADAYSLGEDGAPTHWMPLPAPPTDAK